jgi:general secretion pathway protein A
MYTSYFGFTENPFNLTPDPRYLFLSPHHKEALDHLLYGINQRKGFIAITGGVGTGKTTLCRALLGQLDDSIKSALILNSFVSDMELLETINQEFGIHLDLAVGTKKVYIDKLNQFLLETFRLGGNAVLLIDEGQNLSYTVLEQIRMLSNLETEREKLIQIVLVGQSELTEVLASSSLRQLNERINVRYELRPLDRKDVQGYVEHRMVVGGGRGNLKFTRDAFKTIYEYSQGNPRRINAVCDRALLVSYARDEFTITKAAVRKAIEDIRGNLAPGIRTRDWRRRSVKLIPVFLLVLIILAGFFGWGYRSRILEFFSAKGIFPVLMPKREAASLFLDDKSSLTGLFRLCREKMGRNNYATDNIHLVLFSFDTEIESHTMFKQPFRVLLARSGPSKTTGSVSADLPSNPTSSLRYLLIREVTDDGALAVDVEGNDRLVTRDFLQSNWGKKVSWVYPYENRGADLVKGMRGQGVLKVQKTLKKIGYPVGITGIHDDSTFRSIMELQAHFGLIPDGIVGPRTKALLYQMSD